MSLIHESAACSFDIPCIFSSIAFSFCFKSSATARTLLLPMLFSVNEDDAITQTASFIPSCIFNTLFLRTYGIRLRQDHIRFWRFGLAVGKLGLDVFFLIWIKVMAQ